MNWLNRMLGRREDNITPAIDRLTDRVGELAKREYIWANGNGSYFVQARGAYPGAQPCDPDLIALERAQWYYVGSTMCAQAAGGLPVCVQRRGDDGEGQWVPDASHPLAEWSERPCGPTSDPQWTWRSLVERVWLELDLRGEACLLVLRSSDRRLIGLAPINPARITDPETVTDTVLGEASGITVGDRILRRDEYVRIVLPAPYGRRGRSQYRAAADSIAIDDAVHRRQAANLANRIAPGLILALEGLLGVTPERRRKTVQEMWDDYGTAERDGRPLVISSGDTVHAAPSMAGQVDFEKLRAQAKEEILSILGIPLGLFDSGAQTYDNYSTSLRSWYGLTVLPRLEAICEAITAQAIRPLYGRDIRLWYDLGSSELGLLMLGSRIQAADRLVALGYPANLAARKVGLDMPYVEDLDRPNVRYVIAGRETP